jgi:hypothetical protein
VRSSYILGIILFLGASPVLSGQPADSASFPRSFPQTSPLRWHDFVTNIPGDVIRYGKTAFRQETIPEWIGITALTISFYLTDEQTYRESQRWHNGSSRVEYWGNFFKKMGDGRSQFGLSAALVAYGFISGDNRALRTGSQITEVVLASGATVQVLKHITGRRSPDGDPRYATIWRPFPNQIDYLKHVSSYDAFPSGHITTSMATVIVLAENYPEYTWIKPVGYTLVASVAIGMVNTGIHWYSDYPLGIALGYAFGMIAAHPEGIDVAKDSDALTIYPVARESGIGVGMALQF